MNSNQNQTYIYLTREYYKNNCLDENRIGIGKADDPIRRFKEHNSASSKSTTKIQFEYIYLVKNKEFEKTLHKILKSHGFSNVEKEVFEGNNINGEPLTLDYINQIIIDDNNYIDGPFTLIKNQLVLTHKYEQTKIRNNKINEIVRDFKTRKILTLEYDEFIAENLIVIEKILLMDSENIFKIDLDLLKKYFSTIRAKELFKNDCIGYIFNKNFHNTKLNKLDMAKIFGTLTKYEEIDKYTEPISLILFFISPVFFLILFIALKVEFTFGYFLLTMGSPILSLFPALLNFILKSKYEHVKNFWDDIHTDIKNIYKTN